MMTEIAFSVDTIPIAQPRQRQRQIQTKDGRTFSHNYTPMKAPVNVFKASIQSTLRLHWNGKPLDGCIKLTVVFILPRVKTKVWKRKPMPRERYIGKSDLDNLLKSLKDALTGLLWRDDRQITDVHAYKRMASGDEAPHVDVVVRQVETQVNATGGRANGCTESYH